MPFRRKYNPTFSQIQSIFSLIRKLFVKKSELLTFHMQKSGHFAVLVKGLFLTGKKSFPVGPSPRIINREPFGPTGQTGAPVNFFLQQTSSGNLGVCPSGNLPPTSTLKTE